MKKIIFKTIGGIVSLLIRVPFLLSLYNSIYESAPQKWVNILHQNVRMPKKRFIWNIKLRNGKRVQTGVDQSNYKTLQLALDYKWYSPGIAIVENIILNSLGNDCLYVDVGANLGMRSLCALSNGQETIMFEPNTEVAKLNEERCKLNGFTNYTIVPKGVSSSTGEVTFSIDNSSYKSSINPTANTEVVETTTIQTTSLDDWFKDQKDHARNIYLKVDIEGHELELVSGAKNFIKNFDPTVIMEINEKGAHFEEIYKLFKEESYSCFALSADRWDDQILRPVDSESSDAIERVTDFLFTKNQELIKKLNSVCKV